MLAGLAGLATVLAPVSGALAQETTNTTLEITGGGVSISAPSSIDLGSIAASASAATTTTVEVVDPNYFAVEDLQDANYSVSLQASSLDGAGTNSIASDADTGVNFTLDATEITDATVNTISGEALGAPAIEAAVQTGFTSLDTAVTFMSATSGDTYVGEYGVLPGFNVSVDAYTPVDSYTGTLTYTLTVS